MVFKVKGLSWLGIRTKQFNELASFFENILGQVPSTNRDNFKAYTLENDDVIELFSNEFKGREHFETGPVIGFLVDDIFEAKKAMEVKGIEFIGEIEGDPRRSLWAHFRGPDGNVYELKWKYDSVPSGQMK